jgi:pimeloyl-ACP methyl ester carboxylesterase
LVVAAVLGGSAAWIAGSMLTGPSHQHIGDLPPDLSGQAVQIPSSSGAMLRGWILSPARSRGAIVLMHGLRANRLAMLDRARLLTAAGYSILLFDFQAHGESPGDTITFGYLESKDARAAVDFVKLRYPNGPVGVIGVSMGGAAAVLASPRLDVDAMVLEEVYPDIKTAIADRFQMALGGWARILKPLLSLQMKPRIGVSADQMKPVDRISEIQGTKAHHRRFRRPAHDAGGVARFLRCRRRAEAVLGCPGRQSHRYVFVRTGRVSRTVARVLWRDLEVASQVSFFHGGRQPFCAILVSLKRAVQIESSPSKTPFRIQ